MGQYKQWLHYREVDQQLRTEIASLEHERVQLQTLVDQLANSTNYSDNIIIQALIAMQRAEQTYPATTHEDAQAQPVVPPQQNLGTVSPALSAWGSLPNFDTQEVQEPAAQATTQPPSTSATGPNETLLPSDISAFVNAHSITDPQIKIPWWLRNIRNTRPHSPQESNPVDQQSDRTNHLVERWFQRWNKLQPESPTGNAQEEQSE